MDSLTKARTVRIAFTGPMKSGKTTGAFHIAHELGLDSGWQILAFAEGVKLAAFDVCPPPTDRAGWCLSAEMKLQYVNEWKDYYRNDLQRIGESARQANPNHWIDLLHYRARLAEDQGVSALVIDDLRYRNEFDYCKKQGYTVIKLVPNKIDVHDGLHPSEREWFDLPADFVICKRMDAPLTDYYQQLNSILKQIA